MCNCLKLKTCRVFTIFLISHQYITPLMAVLCQAASLSSKNFMFFMPLKILKKTKIYKFISHKASLRDSQNFINQWFCVRSHAIQLNNAKRSKMSASLILGIRLGKAQCITTQRTNRSGSHFLYSGSCIVGWK